MTAWSKPPRAVLLLLLLAGATHATATTDPGFTLSVDTVVGDRCHHIRAPPLNSDFALFHIHSFENIDIQARTLCKSQRVAEHRCDSVVRQLRAAMREMAAFDISEGVVNVTLDFSLSFAVTQYFDSNAQGRSTHDDEEGLLVTLTVLPEESLESTIASHCAQHNINDHACSKMLLDVEKMVVEIWGCESNSTLADSSADQSFQLPVAAKAEPTQLAVPLDVNGDLDQKLFLLDATKDIDLQVALFCRKHKVELSTCGLLLRRAKDSIRTLPALQHSNRLNITSPVSSRLYPVSRRVYIELSPVLLLPNGGTINLFTSNEGGNEGQLCMFLNYDDAPIMCSPQLFKEPKYYERYVMPVGHHVFLFAYKTGGWGAHPVEGARYAPLDIDNDEDESEWIAAVHFDVVEPAIEFLGVTLNTTNDVSSTDNKRVYLSASIRTRHFDISDPRHRLCVLHNGGFACMQPQALAIVKDAREQPELNRSMVLQLPIFDVTRGMHNFSVMLLSEFGNVIAHLGPLTIDVSLEPGVEPLVSRSELTFVDPTIFVPKRPRVCPKTLIEDHDALRWICDLWRHEWGLFSQNGEDGVLSAIFHHIGVKHSEYVEFGTENANECNTRYWREIHGWTGLLMDGSHENPAINLHREFITAENINALFAKYNVSRHFDLLSIDVDFNDFWILDAIDLELFAPRVIVIEYNSHIPPLQARAVKYDATRSWDAVTSHFGASVSALQLWGESNGYSLVYCESHGVNCFLVCDDALRLLLFDGDESADEDVNLSAVLPTAEALYARPNFFGKGWSYPNASRPGDEWVWLK